LALATSLVVIIDSSPMELAIPLTTCGDSSWSMAFATSLAIVVNSSPMALATSMATLIG
jgi:hypothetical protein